MQFKLTDLLRFTVYFAVGAWLYSLGIRFGLLVWLGTVFGIEVGSRSDYSRILMAVCGSVLGLALATSIFFTYEEFYSAKLFMFFNRSVWLLLLVILWLTTIGIFAWLVTRLKKAAIQVTTSPNRQS